MNTCIDCIPCIFRQALDGARRISDDPALHERVLREVAGWIQAADLAEPPPPRYPSAPMLVGNVNPCSRNSGAAASRRAAKKRKGKR